MTHLPQSNQFDQFSCPNSTKSFKIEKLPTPTTENSKIGTLTDFLSLFLYIINEDEMFKLCGFYSFVNLK